MNILATSSQVFADLVGTDDKTWEECEQIKRINRNSIKEVATKRGYDDHQQEMHYRTEIE